MKKFICLTAPKSLSTWLYCTIDDKIWQQIFNIENSHIKVQFLYTENSEKYYISDIRPTKERKCTTKITNSTKTLNTIGGSKGRYKFAKKYYKMNLKFVYHSSRINTSNNKFIDLKRKSNSNKNLWFLEQHEL